MASEKPFKPLEEFTEGKIGGFALIKQAKENPDILVKDIQIITDEGEGLFLEKYDFATFKREVVEPIKFLQSRGFDKFIPKTEFVWAKDDDGKEKGFLLMKKVKGKEISDLDELPLKIAKELDIFLLNYFKVESETLMSEGDIISPDILGLVKGGLMLNNITVGKTSGDKEEHVYLVDLYPTKGDKNYYKSVSVEKIREQWFTLINRFRQKAGGKYDFLPAQAALRNYLATLERWQNKEKIDEPLKEKEKPPLEFEVKIGAETTFEDIKKKFLKGGLIQFFGTEDSYVYISNLGHDEMRFKNGIGWDEICATGYVELKNGVIDILYYQLPAKEVTAGIERALRKFFGTISGERA